MKWGRRRRGSILVETALTLPMMILLTVGGLTVLWWQHNKTMLNMTVHNEAQRVGRDGVIAGNFETAWDLFVGEPKNPYDLPGFSGGAVQFPAIPLGKAAIPGTAVALACSRPAGLIIELPQYGEVPPVPPPETLAQRFRDYMRQVREVADPLEDLLDGASEVADQLTWAHRVVNMFGSGGHARVQAGYYVVGEGLEYGMKAYCGSGGETALAARAVIRREETVPQR